MTSPQELKSIISHGLLSFRSPIRRGGPLRTEAVFRPAGMAAALSQAPSGATRAAAETARGGEVFSQVIVSASNGVASGVGAVPARWKPDAESLGSRW